MENSSSKKFPLNAKDYELYEEIGEGCSATVFKALCLPLDEVVAIKVLDLERCKSDLENIRREVHTMTLIDHPNLLKAHCSFMAGSCLWIVMPFMTNGSCLHIMKSSFPEGIEQPAIATLLYEVLKAIAYLHEHGHIHRDVKAGNILFDTKGVVKLADFGVSACMFESGDRQRARNTFVGTPCWMAPEVMQQLHGYDFKADIWSFGITALELAHGHAPFSKYPPMKVLLMTLQNAPPGLDYERDKKFSKSFKEIVSACLVKDPKKRPTSEKLLKHPFFKHARSTDYLVRKLLDGLSPLGDRYRMLKEKDAHLLVQNKDINKDKEQLSQQEYMRGISAWNFDVDSLKKQASLIQDDEICNAEYQDLNGNNTVSSDDLSMETSNVGSKPLNAPSLQEDGPNQSSNSISESFQPSLSPLPQALEDQIEIREDDVNLCTANQKVASRSVSEEPTEVLSSVEGKQTKIRGIDKLNLDILNTTTNPLTAQAVNSLPGISVSCLPLLQRLLQQNATQREQVTRIIRYVDLTTGNHTDFAKVGANSEELQIPLSPRERDLQSQVIHMQQSIGKLVEELQRQKTVNSQLERQLSSVSRNKNP